MSDDTKRSKPNEQIERAAASEGLVTASYVRRVVVTHLARQQSAAEAR